jgi:hypothetical protein
VDKITSKTSQNPEEDWARLEVLLEECYQSITVILRNRENQIRISSEDPATN